MEKELRTRANNCCELCGNTENLTPYTVAPKAGSSADECALLCATCSEQIEGNTDVDPNHWRCLNESMWNENDAVKVLAWRMLTRLKEEGWPQDLLDMMYLEDEAIEWAKATGEGEERAEDPIHRDCNGAILQAGDSVTIIKDLNVKGSSIVAKRGTAVRNISLVYDNPEQIEGRVGGQMIVILTQYVKKNA